MTALQAFLHGPRDLHIEPVELDPDGLGPHEVLVDTEVSALKIGTDRGNYEGADYGMQPIEYPRPVGDSSVGVVRAVGSAVTRVAVGDRVADRHGHASAHLFDERGHLAKVPPGVDPEDAVWSHLYTLSGFCYRKAGFEPGENVAVVGLGVLGLGAVALGPLFGARVVALGNSPVRMEMARRMGAHEAFLSSDPDLAGEAGPVHGRGRHRLGDPDRESVAGLPHVRRGGAQRRPGLHCQPAGAGRGEAGLQPAGARLVLRQGHLADRRQRQRRLPVPG